MVSNSSQQFCLARPSFRRWPLFYTPSFDKKVGSFSAAVQPKPMGRRGFYARLRRAAPAGHGMQTRVHPAPHLPPRKGEQGFSHRHQHETSRCYGKCRRTHATVRHPANSRSHPSRSPIASNPGIRTRNPYGGFGIFSGRVPLYRTARITSHASS